MFNKLIGKIFSIVELDLFMESLFGEVDRMSDFTNEINNKWSYGDCVVEFEILEDNLDYDTQLQIKNIEVN